MSNVDFEILRITKYKGAPCNMHYRIRSINGNHFHIPTEWRQGSIRLDLTSIFSASFQKLYKLHYHQEMNEYRFYINDNKRTYYAVTEEIIAAVEKINAEYYLLGHEL